MAFYNRPVAAVYGNLREVTPAIEISRATRSWALPAARLESLTTIIGVGEAEEQDRRFGTEVTVRDDRVRRTKTDGLTLVELIVTVAILAILASAAVPIARFQVKREKERVLHRELWEMRAAIDKYKDLADRGLIRTRAESNNYPPDLQTLADGVDVQGKKVRFLRRIPVDPMTGNSDWGLRSMQDAPDSDSWGGQNIFDVYSKSGGTGLDGTKYSEW